MHRYAVIALTLLGLGGTLTAAEPVTEAAVVKITAKQGERSKTGTGFIVQLTADIAYIVTASHVIEGDEEPKVEFFTRRDRPVKATVKNAEFGDPKGLALLTVTGKDSIPKNLSMLALESAATLKGGDEVTAIGFPRMGGEWAVSKGHLSARQGRELIFAMPVGEGNSGGPLLKGGKVVALVTSEAQGRAFAAAASSVKLFLEGSGLDDSVDETVAQSAAPKPPDAADGKPEVATPPAPVPVDPTAAATAVLEPTVGALLEGKQGGERALAIDQIVRSKALKPGVSASNAASMLRGTAGADRAQATGALTPVLAGNLSGSQLAALLEGTQANDRFNAVYALARNKKIKTALSAAEAEQALQHTTDAVRTSTLAEIIPFLAGNHGGDDLARLLGANEEADRFNVIYALGRNKKIKSPLSVAEANVVLGKLAAAQRTAAIAELIAFLPATLSGADLSALLRSTEGNERYNAIYALARNKRIKSGLTPAEANQAFGDLAQSQRTAAIGELLPFLTGNLAGKDLQGLLQTTQDLDRFNAIYALARNKKIKNGISAAEAELILDGTRASARSSSIGELAGTMQPNLRGNELTRILGPTENQERFSALNALIAARKVGAGLSGEDLKPLLANMEPQTRDAALAQLLKVK